MQINPKDLEIMHKLQTITIDYELEAIWRKEKIVGRTSAHELSIVFAYVDIEVLFTREDWMEWVGRKNVKRCARILRSLIKAGLVKSTKKDKKTFYHLTEICKLVFLKRKH